MSIDLALPGPDTPVIDESRLMAEFGGDLEILAELRDLFLEHAPPLFETIKQGMIDEDLEVLARDAHSLKGACATYGAPRLAMVCKAIELSAKNNDWQDLNGIRDQFEKEYDLVFEALRGMNVG